MSLPLFLLILAAPPTVPPQRPAALAVVYDAAPPVFLLTATGVREPLTSPAWIAPGSRILTGKGGRALIALSTGQRFLLNDGASGTVAERGLSERQGAISQLRSVSGLSVLTPLRSPVASSSGAIALREQHLRILAPQPGAAVPPLEAVLRFDRARNLVKCIALIEDDQGNIVFETEAAGAEAKVPAGALKPGQDYYLRIQGELLDGQRISGEAPFRTLSKEESAALETLRSDLGTAEGDALLLLAAEKAIGFQTPQ